jgi:hypothetical protein
MGRFGGLFHSFRTVSNPRKRNALLSNHLHTICRRSPRTAKNSTAQNWHKAAQKSVPSNVLCAPPFGAAGRCNLSRIVDSALIRRHAPDTRASASEFGARGMAQGTSLIGAAIGAAQYRVSACHSGGDFSRLGVSRADREFGLRQRRLNPVPPQRATVELAPGDGAAGATIPLVYTRKESS